ncbi:MAG: holo-ACP synthase [Actinomycetota bacterium]|nr:holo-ACP synthase [Actinomycetota bacterium]
MIVGVGIDVVDVDRFARALERTPALAARLFTDEERSGAGVATLAGRFAAKEALAKALGAPGGLGWRDAEVIRGPGGRPSLEVRGTVAAAADAQGVGSWHVSISHDARIATAVVVAEA